jgi:eukaryotic-like serine/threonine-protein kinase
MSEDDDDDSVTSPLGPGEVLAGKYRIDRILGKGGMGVVVAATHLELEDKVAVKFLLPQALKNQEAVARFVREARAAVRIKNEHVARIIDVGKLDTGAPYMVMEYLDGMDLGKLRSQGQVSIEDACEYVIQACDAMTDAHAIGIIHRDLKPANLFLTRKSDGAPVVKVLDFGISKVVDPNAMDASLTRTSMTMGSPRYMSPEQLRSAKEVDPRTDVWALGVILYELLSGTTPFRGDTFPELCASILGEPPTPALRERRPEVPPELEAVMLRCVEKSVEARFDSVSELAAALLPFAPASARARVERMQRVSGRPVVASAPAVQTADVDVSIATGKTTAAPWSGPPTTEPITTARGKSGLWIGLGLAAVIVIGAGVYLGTRPSPSPAVPSANLDPVTRSLDTPLPAALTDPDKPTPSASVAPAPAPTPSASVAPVATSVRSAKPSTTEKPKTTPPPPATTTPPKKNPLDIGLK